MADQELIIDDDYCRKMGEFFARQGKQLDEYIIRYISILKGIKQNAITSGATSDALTVYIGQAEKLSRRITAVSENAQKCTEDFLSEINKADKLQF